MVLPTGNSSQHNFWPGPRILSDIARSSSKLNSGERIKGRMTISDFTTLNKEEEQRDRTT
jgi:hypothetical protein